MTPITKPPKPTRSVATRWWDPFAAILLLAAVFIAASRLNATKWTPELYVVDIVAVAGVVLGLALGQSRYSRKMATLMGLAYGILILLWQLGSLIKNEDYLTERLMGIVGRLTTIYLQLMTAQKLTDSLLFVVLMACLFWALGIQSGFSLTRRGNAWVSILPVGVVMFVIHYYYNCPYSPDFNVCLDIGLGVGSPYLAVFLFFAILLIARMAYLQRMDTWRRARSYVSPEASYDLMRFTIATAVLVMLVAWIVPTVRANPIPLAKRLWDSMGFASRWVNDTLSPFFENIRSSVVVPIDDFNTTLALGQGSELSDDIKLTIQAPGVETSAPYYWRNRVYDLYEDGLWQSVFTDTVETPAGNFTAPMPQLRSDVQVIFRITPSLSLWHLYTPSQPIGTNLDAILETNQNADGTIDLISIKAKDSFLAGKTYQVRAVVNDVTIQDMREAGADYPGGLKERYTQLPDTITERTRQLARDITEGLDNPYDQAAVVTDYLREAIEYQPVIDVPAANQETIDWLLFDYKKGFCNYYASAEVILLRSLGIPARLVVGYAQGEVQVEQDIAEIQRTGRTEGGSRASYTVRARDAHAWPEVYFPGIGWVEFEPTASRQPILRPSGDLEEGPVTLPSDFPRDLPSPDDLEEDIPDSRLNLNLEPPPPPAWLAPLRWTLVAILTLLLAALIVWHRPLLVKLEATIRSAGGKPPSWMSRWAEEIVEAPPAIVRVEASLRRLGLRPPEIIRRWVDWVSMSPVARAYVEVNRALRRLGQPPSAVETPAERVRRLGVLLPQAQVPAQYLLYEYQAVTYGPSRWSSGDVLVARQAARDIRTLSIRAWFKNIPARFGLLPVKKR